MPAGCSTAGSTFLHVIPPHVGGDDELCALGLGTAVVHQWQQRGCQTEKRAETRESSEVCVCVCVSAPVCVCVTHYCLRIC